MTRRAFLDFFAPRISISKADSVSHMLRRERVLHAKLPETVENHRPLSKTRLNTPKFSMFSEHLIDVQKHCMDVKSTQRQSLSLLQAPRKLSEKVREQSKIRENLDFFGPWKNLFCSTTFSIAHSQTQQVHSWIARELIYIRKLLRSQLNSQILRYLHFSDLSAKIFDKHVWSRFPLPLYYSRA